MRKWAVPKERIIRLEGNFWDIGEGPSGPNTEIFYDRGQEYGDDFNDPELYPGGENERYLKYGTLYFLNLTIIRMAHIRHFQRKTSIQGWDLERMASIVQNVPTNFDTDLFMPMIRATESISGEKYRMAM